MPDTWTAILAPIGAENRVYQIIDPTCVVTVRNGAPLINQLGSLIGRTTGVAIVGGYIVVTGDLLPGQQLPDGRPTFEANPFDARWRQLFAAGVRESIGAFTFLKMEIWSIRAGFTPAWDDQKIMFARGDAE